MVCLSPQCSNAAHTYGSAIPTSCYILNVLLLLVILWNVNFITCAWTFSDPPCRLKVMHMQTALQTWCLKDLRRNIKTHYLRHKHIGYIVTDFSRQIPISLYTKMTVMRRSVAELCRINMPFFIRE